MKHFNITFALIAILGTMAACSSTPKAIQKEQIVEFKESEVPYVQVTKKNGKVTAELIDVSGEKLSAQ